MSLRNRIEEKHIYCPHQTKTRGSLYDHYHCKLDKDLGYDLEPCSKYDVLSCPLIKQKNEDDTVIESDEKPKITWWARILLRG